jgi:hypothetical protein
VPDGWIFGSVRDVTEAREAQQQLRRSREHLAYAQRVAATGSFALDLRTNPLHDPGFDRARAEPRLLVHGDSPWRVVAWTGDRIDVTTDRDRFAFDRHRRDRPPTGMGKCIGKAAIVMA